MTPSGTIPGEAPLITISLTTISSRLPKVSQTISSLLAQTYPHLAVRLYLSREGFLLDQGMPGPLPRVLEDLQASDTRFKVRFTPNIGPYRKILPFLSENRGNRLLVATADDDTIYPPDWLEGLHRAYQRYRCVVCYRGHRMKRTGHEFDTYRRWMRAGLVRNPDIYNLPTGKDGVLYDSTFFHPGVLDHAKALRIAPTADDLWLKWHYSALEDVPTYVINPDYRAQTFKYDPFGSSLYDSYNRGGGNDATVRRLEEYVSGQERTPFAARL